MTVTASSIFNNVTNAGNLDVQSFRSLNVGGGALTNNGTITINSDGGGGVPRLVALQDTLLDGSGEVVLDGTNNNFRSDVVPNGFTITHDTNHAVRGNGQIIGVGRFVNNGRIEGNSAVDPLRIRTRLEGTGVLKDVTFDFDASGTVHAPGNGVGVVPLEGSYSITHGLVGLEIELGGTTPGSGHDQLISTGTVNLGGALNVRLIDGFVPTRAIDSRSSSPPSNAIAGAFNSTLFPNASNFTIEWEPVEYNPSSVVLEVASVTAVMTGDFNGDGEWNASDVNGLLAIGPISLGVMVDPSNEQFDLTDDGVIDVLDLDMWLAVAGGCEWLGTPYKPGDGNLDGTVDGTDFITWNANKFSASLAWDSGDWNGDGNVDGGDFIAWNTNKFTSSDVVGVPEPALTLWLHVLFLSLYWRRSRTPR